jgi:hypothetical protein
VGYCCNRSVINAKWIALLDVFEAVLQLIFHAIKICRRNFPGTKEELIRSQQILILACKWCSLRLKGVPFIFILCHTE